MYSIFDVERVKGNSSPKHFFFLSSSAGLSDSEHDRVTWRIVLLLMEESSSSSSSSLMVSGKLGKEMVRFMCFRRFNFFEDGLDDRCWTEVDRLMPCRRSPLRTLLLARIEEDFSDVVLRVRVDERDGTEVSPEEGELIIGMDKHSRLLHKASRRSSRDSGKLLDDAFSSF